MAESVHYEDGLVQCSNVDGKKAREGRGRGQELERMCGRGGMMQQKSMRCGRRERGGGKIDRIQS